METILCLPIIFLLTMGIMQYALLQLCRQMVVYASFVAARAVLPVHESEEKIAAFHAARLVCSTISFTGLNSANDLRGNWLTAAGYSSIPGSNGVSGIPRDNYQAAGRYGAGKLAVSVSKPSTNNQVRYITVYMDVPLLFPFADMAFSGLSGQTDFYISGADSRKYCSSGYPHLRLRHTTVIGKNPIQTLGNLPDGYTTW